MINFLTEGKEFSIETLEIAHLRYSKLPWSKFLKLNLMFSIFLCVSKACTYLSRDQESSKPNKSEDIASYWHTHCKLLNKFQHTTLVFMKLSHVFIDKTTV